ncbi:MAG TPA: alpha-glucan family phosphorylase [Mycobacteriales bacterium]
MRALRRFTVRAQLPEPLAPLGELVLNLRWSWHPATMDLFASVDPQLWEACGHDPVCLLGEVAPARLEELAHDADFLGRLDEASQGLSAYLTTDRWYQRLGADAPAGIAYFSMEYGLTAVLPQYSGGLGILAGDHLKTASDLGVPIIGVGLLYRAGYFVQGLSRDGWQTERYPGLDPNGLPLSLTDIRVAVDLPEGRVLHAQVWKAQVGRVPLLLLDTDIEDNEEYERSVTDRLYGGGTDHRLLQEMLLGIGGVRAVRAHVAATGVPAPEVFHANEGHAGFGAVERIREYVEQGLSCDAALATVRAGTVFTTHTPVPAGIDRFPRDLVESHFATVPGVGVEEILALGAEADPDVYNMAHLGLRTAQRSNGVALLHGAVSRSMFGDLWPGFDADEVPITSVTNGVHAPTWVAREVMEIAEPVLSPDADAGGGFVDLARIDDATIWQTRRLLRARLVDDVRDRLRQSWLERGAPRADLRWIETAFDPDVLTVGFARRVPSYKRLTLMLQDPERLRALLLHPDRPVQFVIAGKAHPADDGGKELVQQIVQFADQADVRHRIAFLPGYDMAMAKVLYPGCDVWLNNPLRPLEACGTSGMKAALNGCLNLSIRDGWWDEMYDGENGWAIPTADGVEDPERRDALEADALYDLLESSVAPAFYAGSLPVRWVAMVRHTLESLGPQVLSTRMLRDYVQRLYMPAAASVRATRPAAQDLASWVGHVRSAWPYVRVLHVESTREGDVPVLGETLGVRATVDLGGLNPDDVVVQLAAGRADERDQLRDIETTPLAYVEHVDGGVRYEGELPLERSGTIGYTVRVLPYHPLLSSTAELGLVATA